MTLKRANKIETTNERKQSDLIGLSNGYKHSWLLIGYVNTRVKNLHARELSRNQSILRFDVILQYDRPIEHTLSILGFSLVGKRGVHVLIFLSSFFKVIRNCSRASVVAVEVKV